MPGSPCSLAGTGPLSPPVIDDLFHSMRVLPVSIDAHEEVGGIGATYGVFGGGCAGHAGVPTNSALPTPVLGMTSVITRHASGPSRVAPDVHEPARTSCYSRMLPWVRNAVARSRPKVRIEAGTPEQLSLGWLGFRTAD
jgi:hypothetical protein